MSFYGWYFQSLHIVLQCSVETGLNWNDGYKHSQILNAFTSVLSVYALKQWHEIQDTELPQKTCLIHKNEKWKFIIYSTVSCKTEETSIEKYAVEQQLKFSRHPTTYYSLIWRMDIQHGEQHSVLKHMYTTTARKKIPKLEQNKNVALCAVQVALIRGDAEYHRWDGKVRQVYCFNL